MRGKNHINNIINILCSFIKELSLDFSVKFNYGSWGEGTWWLMLKQGLKLAHLLLEKLPEFFFLQKNIHIFNRIIKDIQNMKEKKTQQVQPVAVPPCLAAVWAPLWWPSALSRWQQSCCDCCWRPVWSGCGTSSVPRHQSPSHWSKSCSPSPQSSVQTERMVKEYKLML